MKIIAKIKRKRQKVGEEIDEFLNRKFDKVVVVDLANVEINPDDTKYDSISYIGTRKFNEKN